MIKRRRFQWTLRGLFFLTTACAIGAGVFASRHRREREVIAWLNESGASVTVETNGPDWLRNLAGDRYFQHATVVEFALGYPGNAPPKTFLAEDARRLEALPKLRLLDLDRFAVFEETLTALGRMRAIEILTIGRGYNGGMAAVERLADAHPGWAIDLAPAEYLYHSVAMRHDKAIFGTLKTLEAVFDMRTAARWKLAAAKWKRGAFDEIAAQRQLIAGLETLRRQDEQQEQLDPGSLRFELAYIRCVTALANLEMIRARGDRPTASTADSSRDAADKLIALVQDDLKQGLLNTFDTVDALQIAGDVLIAACKAADSDAAQLVFKRQGQLLRRLVDRVRPLYDSGKRGGETENMMLANVALALAEARHAHARHDSAAEDAILQRAQPDARLLREACKATWEVGVCTTSQLAFAWQQADEIDRRFAILAGDAALLKAVDTRRAMFFRRTAWTCEQICMMGSGTMEPDHLFGVLDAIERLNTRGLRLDEPLAHFTPEYNPWQAEEDEQAAADGLGDMEMVDELGMGDELEIEGKTEVDGEP